MPIAAKYDMREEGGVLQQIYSCVAVRATDGFREHLRIRAMMNLLIIASDIESHFGVMVSDLS